VAFPPDGPTGLTKTLPSYLYEQYAPDDDLQSFVRSYNDMTQVYVDWFNGARLPVYQVQSGLLLDWIAEGLYGMVRPTFGTALVTSVGMFDTYEFNTMALNEIRDVGVFTAAQATDDVFKRVITWHFFKGDGKYFTERWLKRRIYRFLYGTDGWDAVGSTFQISVIFGDDRTINITIIGGTRTLTGGSLFNQLTLNSIGFNETVTYAVATDVPPLSDIFKQGIDSGVLEMPYQYAVTVRILIPTTDPAPQPTPDPGQLVTDTGAFLITDDLMMIETIA
jgi:hypothetical protein